MNTYRDDHILTGSGSIKFGGYVEAGVNVVNKNLSKLGLRGELGIKLDIDARVNLSDFENTLGSTHLYDLLNNDYSINLSVFGGFKFVGRFWRFSDSVGLEGKIGKDLYQGGLVPRFTELQAARDNFNRGIAHYSASIDRYLLFPVEVGCILLDNENTKIDAMYYDSLYHNKNFSQYAIDLNGLSQTKNYHVRPIVKLFGYELLASPSADVNASARVITHAAEDIDETRAILWGEVEGYDQTNDNGIVGFYYSTQSSYLTVNGKYVSAGTLGSNGRFSATLTDLEEQTTYYYIAAYLDNEGEFHYGNEMSFETRKRNVEISCPDENHPHLIDLGIGTRWSCCNIGATKPEEYGGYYAWGEVTEKEEYTSSNYQYKLNGWQNHISGTKYDAAYMNSNGQWRMPDLSQWNELIKCYQFFTVVNGVKGAIFTGPNGNSIFIPATGFKKGSDIYNEGVAGYYWTDEIQRGDNWTMFGAYNIIVRPTGAWKDSMSSRGEGRAVRAIYW